jgi:hypothetical protein
MGYKCPKCKATVIWSLASACYDITSVVKCGNNITSSRITWNRDESKICQWTGMARRRKDGTVEIFHIVDGVKRKLFKKYNKNKI